MRPTARRAAATAATALFAGLVTVLPPTAAAEEPVPPFVDSWLVLTTGSDSTVGWYGTDGSPLADQRLTSGKNCALSTSGDLLEFVGAPTDRPGLRDGSIGVREKGSANGQSCAQVDSSNGESLTLVLGSEVTQGGLAAVAASLDLDMKQNAQVLATATYGDRTYEFGLVSGPESPSPELDGIEVTRCNEDSADSGTDNGANAHCRFAIGDATALGTDEAVYFDRVDLRALVGSFSLDGGSDGEVGVGEMPAYVVDSGSADDGLASIVELAQVLDCEAAAPTFSGPGVVGSTWQRLENRSGEACTPYAYTTEAGTDGDGPFAHFRQSPDADTDAQAVWSTQFPYSGPVPELRFAFDTADGSAGPFGPLADCADVGITWDGESLTSPGEPPATGSFACLLSTTTSNAKGEKTVTFTVYVLGDAWMRR